MCEWQPKLPSSRGAEVPMVYHLSFVPQGMGIVFSPYHMHRDPDIYGDDANEFRPERWEEDRLKNVGLGFMPFHGAPRICLGSKYSA
ncbi:hypothetical protein sscle_01g010820 [Sclerotinia sclerotiorum 1980 UF-70]|uniref:Cytochrome P450 n=1 Tax=Sclerotinia sclerotiorum (strain ATCC 18683 / 1980 / Ss-1) TaxID=665079 RepID=A0A1D9PUV7_SCLS1|nr:hypothetical protein sscle_01g010820 [Sclerotinia sclerotiorum 1980 UF-70]